jgi:hypothetical protein
MVGVERRSVRSIEQMKRSFIKKRWPLWVRLSLAPFAWVGMACSLPIVLIFAVSDFDKATAITDFWTEPQ